MSNNNHLIIGLGGTGGNIIRSFRKSVYQAYGDDLAPNVNVRYLWVDSDENDMRPNNQSWTILGHSVELPPISRLLISGLNLKDVIDNVNHYPNIKPWIGNRADWTEILNSADATKVVGGQKRRLGRFLFAASAGRFREKITHFVSDMEKDKSRTVTSFVGATFHVCCGLAGGTGSGTVIDVISQIRAAYPGTAYRIIVYAQLPESKPEGNRARENYHANGYAALMELNALAVNSWRPHDLLSIDGRRLVIQDPFNCCYLFSDENEANVAVSLNELPDIVASFLFQKIVQLQPPNVDWGGLGDIINRQETFENTPAGKASEKSPRGEPRRTRAFFSFGMKQIVYPEVEIREYLTYSFAQQAARQLLYNNWVDRDGYREVPVNNSFEEFVADPKQQEHWHLDEQHLTLSRGILQSEIDNNTWKPITDFWKSLIPNYVLHVLDQYKDSVVKMMPELIKLCETAYNEQYRGSGVRSFYEIKRGDMTDHVRELRLRIETDLFSEWRTGVRSMHDIERLVSSLIGTLTSKLQTLDLNVSKVSENGERYKLNETKYADNNRAWGKLGPLSIAIGKHKKILSAQAEVLVARYIMKTQLEGYLYGRKLVESLLQELKGLSSSIGYCKATIIEATTAFKVGMDSRLADAGNKDIGKQMVRQYDPPSVRDFVRDLSRDAKQQSKQTSEVRERLVELLKDKLTFANLAETVPSVAFQNALSESCARSAAAAHADAIALNPEHGKVLDVSLIDLLRREYEGNEKALRQYTMAIMNMAMNYLKLDDRQKTMVGPGIPSASNDENGICATYNTIIAPEAPEAGAFRDHFCAALKESTTHGVSHIVTNKSRPQEISIITLTNVFPARFITCVSFLKTKYEERIKASGKRAFLELHSEGETLDIAPNQEFFDLYPETYKSVDILPWIMLAQTLNLITAGKDYTTGRDVLNFNTVDSDGLPENKPLGSDLESVIQNADPGVVEELKFGIRHLLGSDYLRLDKRRELEAALLTRIRATGETLSIDAPLYKQQKEALVSIRKILEIEA